jgi:mannose-6-phosphate isomerase-like protein (cupin superfamily)
MPKPIKIEKDDVSPMELAKGLHTHFNVYPETVGSETVRMGVCHHDPDMSDLEFSGSSEEAFYVAKGSIKIVWATETGGQEELLVHEGEQVYLPKGLRFKLRSTGESAINVFAAGLSSAPSKAFSEKVAEAANRLRLKLAKFPSLTGD